jgi:pimeloyl-ACP methyl ester carboxylesterase
MLRVSLVSFVALLGCYARPVPHAEPPALETSRAAPNNSAAPGSTDPRFDAELSGSAYPYPVQAFELSTQRQRLKMAYLDVRPSQPNGRTVLLLHGKNFSAAYWQPTIALLVEHGYRVVAPDQVGKIGSAAA